MIRLILKEMLYYDTDNVLNVSHSNLVNKYTRTILRILQLSMGLNLCQKSRHVNNGQFKSKHVILKMTPV